MSEASHCNAAIAEEWRLPGGISIISSSFVPARVKLLPNGAGSWEQGALQLFHVIAVDIFAAPAGICAIAAPMGARHDSGRRRR
eukprot:scaffold139804_cov33-Prasinocladus_malaysianus.AAC.1